MNGWIKLHRSLLDWEWYDDNKTFKLFIHLILKANHLEKKYRGIIIKEGQVMTGLNILSKETNLSMQSVRTSLNRLKSTNELTIKTSTQGSIIQLINYNKYQLVTNKITNEQQTSNKRVTTNKKEENIKNKEIRALYDSFLMQSNGMQFPKEYKKYIEYLFGKNELEKPLDTLLNKDQQIKPSFFDKLMNEKKEGVSILETTFSLNNYTARKYKTFYSTLLNWVRR